MKEKPLKSFLASVDKIVSGQPLKPSEYEQYDKDDQELLCLAQLLADGSWARQNDELADDELDLVAGGANSNTIFTKDNKL
jgi:hypothetical protein